MKRKFDERNFDNSYNVPLWNPPPVSPEAANSSIEEVSNNSLEDQNDLIYINPYDTDFTLYDTEINDEGAKELAGDLESSTVLQSLTLLESDMSDIGIGYITSALRYNTTLLSLSIEGNSGTDIGYGHFANLIKFNTTLKELNIGGGETGPEGAVYIADSLTYNTSLISLDISNNYIGDIGILAFKKSFLMNSTLRFLSTSRCNITKAGVPCIVELFDLCTSLKSLDISNNPAIFPDANMYNALINNSTLTSLNISNNNLIEADFIALAKVLRPNKGLKILKVGDESQITNVSISNIFDALTVNKSLTSLSFECCSLQYETLELLCKTWTANMSLVNLDLTKTAITDSGANCIVMLLKSNTSIVSLNCRYNYDISENGSKWLDNIALYGNILYFEYPNMSEQAKSALLKREEFVNKLVDKWLECKKSITELPLPIFEKLYKYQSAIQYVLREERNMLEISCTFDKDYRLAAKKIPLFWHVYGIAMVVECAIGHEDIVNSIARYLNSTFIKFHNAPQSIAITGEVVIPKIRSSNYSMAL